MKIVITYLLLCLTAFLTKAQSIEPKKDSIPFERKNFGISIGSGTIGFNVNLHHQISRNFGIRFGYSEAYYSPQYFTIVAGNSINVTADFQIKLINLQLDYFPFKNKIFRITTGISRNNKSYFLDVTPLTGQTFGYISYTPESIGKLKVEAVVNEFNPYFGIGFGKTIPNTKFGMGLDLGLFYHGSPKFKLITTGSFGPSNNEKNILLMNNAFVDWFFFPMVNVNIIYKITK